MARLGDPADLRLIVLLIRWLRRWTQEDLSQASGVDRGLISDYELGNKAPKKSTLERLAVAAGLPFTHVEMLLPVFRSARLAIEGKSLAADTARADSISVAAGLDQVIVEAVLPHLTPHLMALEASLINGSNPTAKDRATADRLGKSLLELSYLFTALRPSLGPRRT